MYNFFDDNFFPVGFGKPTRIIFNTNGLKDMMPACWKSTDNGYKASCKTLGIDKVNVEMVENGIKVSGSNNVDGQDYDTTIELPIAKDIINNIIKITHHTECGITIVELFIDRPEKKKIEIKNI